MNLEELVKRCRNHDEEAVTELINETKTSGFFVARMITGEVLKTSDFDETHYEELVEKAKTDETVKEELTAYEEKYASIISLKDARDQAERNVNNKKSESEYYYSFAVQVIIDLKDAQNVVALVEARNDALVSFDTLVKEISAKDPLTEDVSSLIASMEETVTTMQTIEENGMDQKLWPSDLNEQYSALSSRMENIIAAAGDFVEDSAVWNTYAAAVTEKKALVQEAETALSTAEQALTDATAAYGSACVINVPVNEDVANIENAKPGETVDLNTTEITNEVLTSAKEHQVLLEITGNGYVWRIDATTVEGEVTEPVNLSVDRHTKSIPTDLIQKTAGENSYYEFAIVHDGDFGFDAVLSFFTDIKHSGKTAELYHYENEALKKVSEITVDKEGYATFTQDHASSYVIVIKEPKKDALPDTGAGKLPVGMVFVCGISGALALVLMKKRKEA